MTMAENTGTPPTDAERASTPDYRPRPRYGELAPEGWTWTPPQDQQAPAASADVPVPAAVAATTAPQGSADKPTSAVPGWDRPVTLSLLILGLLGTFLTISILGSMPQALQMLYTEANLGDYTAADSVATIITVGSVGQGVIWAVTAMVSILLIIRSRRAFYVPLIGGVVAFVALIATMAVVLSGDTALLDYFSQP